MSAFRKALELDTSWDDSGLAAMQLDYVLGTNDRGREAIGMLERYVTGPLKGRRMLDIGSGHGGASVASSEAGAEVVAIEIGEDERRLGDLNFADHGLDISPFDIDATDPVRMAPLGKFDLIMCDNVIEHVLDAGALIFNIARAMTPNGRCYVTAPNAGSLNQVLTDCHALEFGLSLLDRFDAQAHYNLRGHPGIYYVGDYFDFNQYVAMFAYNGLEATNIVPVDISAQAEVEAVAMADKLRAKLAERPITGPTDVKVAQAVQLYLDRFDSRLAQIRIVGDEQPAWLRVEFFRDYMVQRWDFVARPREY